MHTAAAGINTVQMSTRNLLLYKTLRTTYHVPGFPWLESAIKKKNGQRAVAPSSITGLGATVVMVRLHPHAIILYYIVIKYSCTVAVALLLRYTAHHFLWHKMLIRPYVYQPWRMYTF